MKKIIAAGIVVLAFTGGAAEAQAFEWNETKSTTVRAHAWGDNCSTPGEAFAVTPDYARNLEAISPLPGQHVAWAYDSYEGEGPLQVTGVKNVGDGGLTFTVLPADWCEDNASLNALPDADCGGYDYGEYGEECNADFTGDESWETDTPVNAKIRYQIRKQIVMTRNLAKNLTVEALYRRYSWFGDANHAGYRCQISGNRGRCRHPFGIGDGFYNAVVKLRLVGRSGQKPVWNYTLRVLQIDDYCRRVSHAGNCVSRIKKRRNRVSLPYWVRARNA